MLKKLFRNLYSRRFLATSMKTVRTAPFYQIPQINCLKLMMATNSLLLVNSNLENFDLNLQQASDLGDSAVVELMDLLQERILGTCKAYRDCLKKQMEVIEEASAVGSMSAKWDDLPEYRALAHQLSQELSDYIAILNTLGQLAHQNSLKFIQQNHVKLIDDKHREVWALLESQMGEIKKFETVLLELHRQSILQENLK